MKERSEKSLHILCGYAIIAVLFWKRTFVCFRKSAGMAQSVEQLIRNQQVGGSSPPTSSIKKNACESGVLFLCPFLRGQVYSTRLPCFSYKPAETRPDADPSDHLLSFPRGFALSARADETNDSRNEKTQDGIPRNKRQMRKRLRRPRGAEIAAEHHGMHEG